MQLEVTDKVFNRINQLVESTNDLTRILRVSVDGGGCFGYMYKYEFTSTIELDDYVIEKNGIKVVIDQISQPFMNGCVIDFVEQLGSASFEVKNPGAASKCGCGNSFSV